MCCRSNLYCACAALFVLSALQVHLKAFENDRFSAKEDDIDASVAAAGGGGGASYAAAAAAED